MHFLKSRLHTELSVSFTVEMKREKKGTLLKTQTVEERGSSYAGRRKHSHKT